MKSLSKKIASLGIVPLFLFALSMHAAPAAPAAPAASATQTNAVVAERVERKSVFNDDLKNGRDPFFPKSTRRAVKISSPAEPVVPPIVQLALKGISGSANNRLALINNQPVAVGETVTVRVANGQVKVRCWEIRENSVLISVEGDPEKKELRLRENL